jgi:hypothetical protein
MRQPFLKNDRASTATEFAVLAPLFIFLVLMVMQVGVYFYYSATLQKATDMAVRQILIGNTANSALNQSQFITQNLCPQASNFNCASFVVNLVAAPTDFYTMTNKTTDAALPLGYAMSGLNAPAMDNTKTSYCLGGNGSVMVAQVFYPMPLIGVPSFFATAQYNGQSVVWIQADDVFKNEPFSTSYLGC